MLGTLCLIRYPPPTLPENIIDKDESSTAASAFI